MINTRIRHLLKNLHSEALNPLRSLSCSRLSKLLDLKADSSGGPNRLSEAGTVELNLEGKQAGKNQILAEEGQVETPMIDGRKRSRGRDRKFVLSDRKKCDKHEPLDYD